MLAAPPWLTVELRAGRLGAASEHAVDAGWTRDGLAGHRTSEDVVDTPWSRDGLAVSLRLDDVSLAAPHGTIITTIINQSIHQSVYFRQRGP